MTADALSLSGFGSWVVPLTVAVLVYWVPDATPVGATAVTEIGASDDPDASDSGELVVQVKVEPADEHETHPVSTYSRDEILHIRHHSLYTPRDFDLSPFFRVVKPTIERNFVIANIQAPSTLGGGDAD